MGVPEKGGGRREERFYRERKKERNLLLLPSLRTSSLLTGQQQLPVDVQIDYCCPGLAVDALELVCFVEHCSVEAERGERRGEGSQKGGDGDIRRSKES
jgi:hypothetical protein